MHWLSRCSVFYFREPTFPTKSLMEPNNITPGSMGCIPALNIECSRSLARSLGDAAAWETPPHGRCSLSLARRRSVPSPSLFDTLGHDGPEAQSHSAGPAKRTACPSEHRVQQHRVQQHSGSTPPQRHTLAVVVPVGSQQKARAAIGMVACSATSLMTQPTCDTLAEDTDPESLSEFQVKNQ